MSGNWTELTAGPFASQGCYVLTVPASAIPTAGMYQLAVANASAETFFAQFEVVDKTDAEVFAELSTVRKMLTNRAAISGNRYIVYDDDGVSVFKQFDQKDQSGNPTNTQVFSRTPA